jgi:hypothetical protein
MNPLVIVLGVILVVIILMSTFSKFFSGESALASKANLVNGIPDIPVTALSKTDSANRTYSIWTYVNVWTSGANKMILGRSGDILLYLDSSTAKLKCKIKPSDIDVGTTGANGGNGTTPAITNTIDITNNFPIQKWVFITAVVDSGGVCDLYLDGKLVKSVKTDVDTSVDSTKPIIFGKGHDTYIADAKFLSKTLGPKDVWTAYSKGNSGSSIKSAVGSYNVNLSILKDNVKTSSYSVF